MDIKKRNPVAKFIGINKPKVYVDKKKELKRGRNKHKKSLE